jgi:hypothetical protein
MKASLCTIAQALIGIRSELRRIADALEKKAPPTPPSAHDVMIANNRFQGNSMFPNVLDLDSAREQRRSRRLPWRSKTERCNYPSAGGGVTTN